MTWIALPLLLLAPAQEQVIIADRRIERTEQAVTLVDTPTLETPDPEAAARENPIVVERNREEEPARAILGSRIPRTETVHSNGNVATSTGIAGLTPGSGMEPFHGANRVSKKVTSTCISDTAAIGARAACLLLEGEGAMASADYTGAGDIYRYLLSSDEFTAAERLEGGRRLLAIGVATDDLRLREEALIRLLDSNLLDLEQRASARRNLVDLALRRDAPDLALARLEEYVALVPDDAQSLANLAVLRRNHGREGAEAAMQQAIAAREAAGGTVPQGWRDLAAGLPFTPPPSEVAVEP